MQNTSTQVPTAAKRKAQIRAFKIALGLTLLILTMYCFLAPTVNPGLKGRGLDLLASKEALIILMPILAVIWAVIFNSARKVGSTE